MRKKKKKAKPRCSECSRPLHSRGKCRKHYLIWWRQTHPIEYAYQTSKHNAKRRGKAFELTLEQFKKFCVKYKYLQKKGIYKDSYSIDRIDETRGYTEDNIQIMKVGENKKKHLEYDWRTKSARVAISVSDDSDDPF